MFELGLTKINSIRMEKIVVYRCLTSLRTKEIVIKLFSAGNVNRPFYSCGPGVLAFE